MWTLVIVVLIGTPQNAGAGGTGHDRGGASSTITDIEFTDQAKCQAAEKTMTLGDTKVGNPGVNGAAWAAVYNIYAKCVAR